MLWVYCQYKYFKFFSVGIDIGRQNMTFKVDFQNILNDGGSGAVVDAPVTPGHVSTTSTTFTKNI